MVVLVLYSKITMSSTILFKWEQGPNFPGLNSSFDIQIFLLGQLIGHLKETLDIIVLTGAFKFQAGT